MNLALLISQLIVAPVLVFEAGCYLLAVRRRDAEGRVRVTDWVVIALAAAACLALLPLVLAHDSGANDRIWHPVLSVLTSFFAFPSVLLLGYGIRSRGIARQEVDSN